MAALPTAEKRLEAAMMAEFRARQEAERRRGAPGAVRSGHVAKSGASLKTRLR